MGVFEPREFFRVAQNSVVLPFYGTLICMARDARLQLSWNPSLGIFYTLMLFY